MQIINKNNRYFFLLDNEFHRNLDCFFLFSLDRYIEYKKNPIIIIMTDILVDDPSLGQLGGSDIRVFGKWSGADVQISDMSLEVC